MNITPAEIIKSHYKTIGRKGGLKTKKKYGKPQLRKWGKLGGRPRKKPVDN